MIRIENIIQPQELEFLQNSDCLVYSHFFYILTLGFLDMVSAVDLTETLFKYRVHN